jgi:(p)ppGpp synthase/HD superfamily hydrolase
VYKRQEAHLTELAQSSADVLLVVSADKLHNLRSLVMDYRHIGEAVWDRFKGGRVGTLWYYHAALDVLKPRTDLPLVVELEHTLAELEAMLPPAVD